MEGEIEEVTFFILGIGFGCLGKIFESSGVYLFYFMVLEVIVCRNFLRDGKWVFFGRGVILF